MRDRRHARRWFLLLALALGCASEPMPDAGDEAAPGCKVDSPTEVGDLTLYGENRCTATLIGPRLAVTAAHCLWPPFRDSGASLAVVFSNGNERRSFAVRRARSFDPEGVTGSATGLNDDVALLELVQRVPVSLAVPRSIAREPLAVGAPVTLVAAASCGQAVHVEGRSLKSFHFDPLARDRQLCPGDSGAPVLEGTSAGPGPIAAVASGYATTSCAAGAMDRMIFGDVARLGPAIRAQELAWLRSPVPAGGP